MIFLKELKVNNFKNLNELIIKDIHDIKALIGINGAGKSNFFNTLFFLSCALNLTFKNFLQLYRHKSSDYANFNLPEEPISISLIFCKCNNINENLYEYNLTLKAKYNVVVDSKEINWGDFDIITESIVNLTTNETSALNNADNKILNCSLFKNQYTQVKNFISNIAKYDGYQASFFWPNQNAKHLHNKDNLSQIKDILLNLFSSYQLDYNKIINLFKTINPLIEDVIIKNNNILIKLYYLDNPIDINYLSDGTKRVISLLTILLLPLDFRPSMLLLEEVEIGVSPHILEIIGDLIDSYSQDSQVILTTHSPLLLNKIDINNIAVANVDVNTGFLTVNKIDREKINLWLDRYTIGDLWLMNLLGGTLINN